MLHAPLQSCRKLSRIANGLISSSETSCISRLAIMRPQSQLLRLKFPHKPPTSSAFNSVRIATSRRFMSSATVSSRLRTSAAYHPGGDASYFLSNRVLDPSHCLQWVISRKGRSSSTTASTGTAQVASTSPDPKELPPHRRRKALKAANHGGSAAEAPLPPDASSLLTTSAVQSSSSMRRLMTTCLALSKPRLTVLVVLSAMAPYALYPTPELLSPALTETTSLSPLTLTFLTIGTAMCSASANALNMCYEPKTDAMMTRTRNRPLVRNLISRRGAVMFAIVTGTLGVGALYFGVNPTVSGLGFANIVLYAGVYTPLKAVSAFNTWVGALVGGIPPLMGWAAAAGETASKDGSWRELLFAGDGSSIGGWLMAGLLFAWQFPHFMALSWPIREEYKKAGLRMLAWTNPSRNARVALRYSLVFVPLSLALCAAGVTDWSFAALSLPINVWIAKEAVAFWKLEGHKGSARGLFWASIWHLPGFMVLALLCKQGIWARACRAVFGETGEAGEWEEEELEEMRSMTNDRVKDKVDATKAKIVEANVTHKS